MIRTMRRVLDDARRCLATYTRAHESGVTASIFAVALLVLLGMVALGIDGGRIYDERRRAQNAADHAAIAAAFASCISTSTDPAVLKAAAVAAGLDSAKENGYDNDGTSNTVTIDIAQGATAADHEYEAFVETEIGTTFAQVIGFSNLDTNADAKAEATGCDETATNTVPAIHAGGTSCPGGSLRTVEFNGNEQIINGKTTAYGGLRLSGNFNEFHNPPNPSVEYGGSFSQSGSSNVFDLAQQPVTVPSAEADRWPAGLAPSNQTTAMWDAYSAARVNSSATTSTFNVIAPGVYYTSNSGGVDANISPLATSFIIVNRTGPIRVLGTHNGRTFSAHTAPAGTPANMMFVTGYDGGGQPCDQDAIRRSDEGGTWNGTWWAPRGRVIFSGNLNTVNGGLVAHAVHFVGGNENTINGGTGAPAAEPDVLLIE